MGQQQPAYTAPAPIFPQTSAPATAPAPSTSGPSVQTPLPPTPVHAGIVPLQLYQPRAPRTDGANALYDPTPVAVPDWNTLPDADVAWGPDQLAPYAAPFGMRLVALIVDLTAGSVALSFVFILLGLLQLATNASNATIGAMALVSLVAWWPFYFISFWARSGRTLGYRVAGLQLVKSDGSLPTLSTAVMRFMGTSLTVMSLFAGYLCILWDRRKQAAHDKFAGTMVVKE